jgi:hypothetical protein
MQQGNNSNSNMYIPNYNTFFIHVTKCGGTSVELFFLNEAGFNYSHKDMTNSKKRAAIKDWFIARKLKPPLGYETQHITAHDAKEREVRQFLNADYTFAIVRNPWDRFVSETIWMQQKHDSEFTFDDTLVNFRQYAFDGFKPHWSPQWKYLYDDDMNLLIDDVFKLEKIDEAEDTLSKQFGIPVKFGKHNTTERTHYSDYITPEIKEKLYPLIKKDLELFGYE